MSDQVAATVEAPAPAVETAQPVVEAAPKPATFQEFQKNVGKGVYSKVPETTNPDLIPVPELNSAGRKIDPVTKQFVAAAEASAEATGATPAPEPALTPEFVKIPLPDGHPLRARGKDHLQFPKEDEEYGRWAVNEARRRDEYQSAMQSRDEATRRALESEAESKFWQEHAATMFGPEFRQTYDDLEKTYGKDHAEQYKRGVLANAQEQLSEAKGQVTKELEQQAGQGRAKAFAEGAAQHARQRYPLMEFGDFQRTLAGYSAWIETLGMPAHADSWVEYADRAYALIPKVRTALQQQVTTQRTQEIDRLAQEKATQLDQQRLAEHQRNRQTNPMGAMPAVQTGIAVPSPNGGAPKSFREYEEQLKRRVTHGAGR